MPTPAYMTIAGATQGDISAGAMSAESVGTMSNRAQEGTVQIQEFELDVQIPTDPQSGQPSRIVSLELGPIVKHLAVFGRTIFLS